MFVFCKLDPSIEQGSGGSFQSILKMSLVHGETPEGAEMVFAQVFTISTFIQTTIDFDGIM
jgi:hypothetical protein